MPPAGAEEGGLGQWHLLLVSHDLTRRNCGREIFEAEIWVLQSPEEIAFGSWCGLWRLNETQLKELHVTCSGSLTGTHTREWSGTLNALVRLYLGNRAQVEQKPSSHLKRKLVKISKCCGFSQSSGILTDVSLVNFKCLRKNYCVGFLFSFVCTFVWVFCVLFVCFVLPVLFKCSDYRHGLPPVCERHWSGSLFPEPQFLIQKLNVLCLDITEALWGTGTGVCE